MARNPGRGGHLGGARGGDTCPGIEGRGPNTQARGQGGRPASGGEDAVEQWIVWHGHKLGKTYESVNRCTLIIFALNHPPMPAAKAEKTESAPPPAATPAAIREGLAQRIREAMQRRGMGGAELSRRLGVSQPTIHAWVHGSHGLRRQNIRRLAAELGVDPAWLEFGADGEAEARAADGTELALLRLYRELDPEQRAAVLRLIATMPRPAPPEK